MRHALCASAEAQRPAKTPRIGWLTGAPLSATTARVEAFRQGLRELGYVEGKSILVEWRSSEGKPDLMSTLAAELLRLKVDVIVTAGSAATRPAKAATKSIPIVMAQDDDPVGNGFVASLARPGGNITGLSTLSPELSGKRLEILKEVVPKLSRLAVVGTSSSEGQPQVMKEIKRAAAVFSVKLQSIDVLTTSDIEPAFGTAVKGQSEALLWLVAGRVDSGHRAKLAELAVKNRLPAIYEREPYVSAGGLMSYGINLYDLDRRAAVYVDKILKGAKPAELPSGAANEVRVLH
jgi:putative tryptophan/tyrosine transport system substrate-binding protein